MLGRSQQDLLVLMLTLKVSSTGQGQGQLKKFGQGQGQLKKFFYQAVFLAVTCTNDQIMD